MTLNNTFKTFYIIWNYLIFVVADIGIGGKVLQINNFSRECAVPYVCIADNGLTENVSTTITLIPKCKF